MIENLVRSGFVSGRVVVSIRGVLSITLFIAFFVAITGWQARTLRPLDDAVPLTTVMVIRKLQAMIVPLAGIGVLLTCHAAVTLLSSLVSRLLERTKS